MLFRGPAVLFMMCAACATAGDRQQNLNGNPEPDAGHPPSGSPDAAPHIDAAPMTDAPAITTPDAPASGCAYSGVLATWSLSGQPGTQASTVPASSAPSVTAANLVRATALTAQAGTGSMNSSNWPTAAQLDPTKYYSIAITPPTGCTLSVSSVGLDMKASSTGPASAVVATSADGFTQTSTAAPNAVSSPSLSVSGASTTVEIRIFGYGATGTSGTMRVQNTLTVTGSLQ